LRQKRQDFSWRLVDDVWGHLTGKISATIILNSTCYHGFDRDVIMEPENLPDRSEIYHKVFERCAAFALPAPWDFLVPDPDCRGPIPDPDATLAALQNEFTDDQLVDARVIERLPENRVRLSPVLVYPTGGVVALRDEPGRKPFELLTCAGALSGRDLPVFASMRDARTKDLATGNARCNALYVTCEIREVALLRSVGLAASMASGLDERSLETFRRLSQTPEFSLTEPSKAYQEAMAAGAAELDAEVAADADALAGANSDVAANPTTPAAPDPAMPPVPEKYVSGTPPQHTATWSSDEPLRVLLGWRPLVLTLECPSWPGLLAAELDLAEQYLRLDFADMHVWRPVPEYLEKLKYLLKFRDEPLIRECLSGQYGDHFSIAAVRPDPAGPSKNRPPFMKAWDDLQDRLDEDRKHQRLSEEGDEGLRTYERLAEEELVRPLEDWALAHSDAQVRNAGVELAYVCRLLHRLKPWLQEELSMRGEAFFRRKHTLPQDLLREYMKLVGQFTRLLSILGQRRDASPGPQFCFNAGGGSGVRLFAASPAAESRVATKVS
jgi:hypothetical protein